MRIALGLYLFAYYGRLLPEFFYYFGPGGMIDPALVTTPKVSLVLWLWHPIAIAFLGALLFLLIGLFTVGLWLEWVLPSLFALHLSFHHANPFIIHEPQQLTNLLLLLCFFLPVGERAEDREDALIVDAAIAYLGVYYFIAGAKKLADPLWREGASLWNLVQWPPFHRGGWLVDALVAHPSLARGGSYFALAFEMGFLLVVFTRLRPVLVAAGLVFHLAIFLTLEVGSFPYVLLPWYALCLDERTRAIFLRPVRK